MRHYGIGCRKKQLSEVEIHFNVIARALLAKNFRGSEFETSHGRASFTGILKMAAVTLELKK